MASRLGYFYRLALSKYPTATQAIQVSLIMGSSDLIAQCAIEKAPLNAINWRRTAQFSGMGLLLVGPTLKFWYGKLDIIVSRNQKEWKRAVKKVSLDQLLFAPCFTAVFTSSLSAIQGLKPNEIVERLKRDYCNILIMNYKIWPAAQLINFAVIPLNFQVVFAQFVAVIWNTYLSMTLGNSEVAEPREKV